MRPNPSIERTCPGRSGHAAQVLVAVIVVALAACTTIDVAEKDDWIVLGRSGTDRPEVVLVRRELPTTSVRSRFPVLLQIKWGYDSLPNGMPTEKEIERGRDIYTALERIIGKDGVYAMTRTGDGGRTIYYYVSDPARHAAALRSYFDSLPPISVRVIARDEPDWHSVREVLGAAK